MSLQVQEITNFRSGIDLSLDPILAPSDAFVNLRNGFVHRGVLQSRPGFKHFATGNDKETRVISRVSDEITNETADTGDGSSDYSFTLANTEVERTDVVVNAPTEGKTITFSYDPDNRTVSASGDTGGGTNSINYQTGAMEVSFDGAIGGGNNINVTYNYHPDNAIMGIHEYVKTSSRELIVLDQQFPYKYDATNRDFERIPFTGGASTFTGSTENFFTFQNWRLHSRGAVPAAAGSLTFSDRLFFTNNVDEPFVYDGTNVDVISSMAEYRAPSEGSLNKALHVLSYGERLIWLRPTLGPNEFSQGILFGPINDNSGLALDYQASTSGTLSAATDSPITSAQFVRGTLIVWFEKDIYALELTRDPFQPFRWTKIEDERGVEPTHGAVSFFGSAECPGRLGIIGTTGRRTERVDNRIPNFTRDEIDQDLIKHVFGEEMEEDSQFWWTYPSVENSNNTTSDKVLVKNFEEENYAIYDIPMSVLNKTIVGQNIVWNNLQETFNDANVIWNKWGKLTDIYKTLFGDHHGFIFSAGDSFNDGIVRISPKSSSGTAISLGSPTSVETEYHHFSVGDTVEFRNVEGTTELNGLQGVITNIDDRSSFDVAINSTGFTAYTGGGEVIKVIDFQAEFVPFNPLRPQGERTHLGKMDFLVKSTTGEYTIDFFEDRSNQAWTSPKKTFTFTPGGGADQDIWFSINVDNTADFHRWKISQKVINEKISIKSIRVFFKNAGVSNV